MLFPKKSLELSFYFIIYVRYPLHIIFSRILVSRCVLVSFQTSRSHTNQPRNRLLIQLLKTFDSPYCASTGAGSLVISIHANITTTTATPITAFLFFFTSLIIFFIVSPPYTECIYLFSSHVWGANMQPNALAIPSILLTESMIVLGFSSLGSITVSVIVFFTHPDSPINISNRMIIRYLSNSLFIRIIYTD